jgi:superfamily I DNA/RNA helicase
MSTMGDAPTPFGSALGALEETQRRAVLADPTAPLLISAGAGSGKTRVLTMRIAALLEHHHARPEQILALTFTKKACEEMQERVFKLCPQIAKHALTVKTFHSFCLDVVREHHARLHFPHEPTVLDAMTQADIIKSCIEDLDEAKKAQVQTWKPGEDTAEVMGAEDMDSGSNSRGFSNMGQSKGPFFPEFIAWCPAARPNRRSVST